MDSSEILKEVAVQVSACTRCSLHLSRKNSVPGEGPANAQVMFIGEGPGFYENEQGRPFVGQAGKLLDELLGKAGLVRHTVFIANVVKCRPPGNRDPLPEELTACGEYLERQINAINPKVIVTLGRFSMARFLPMAKISDVHGQSMWVRGRLIVPMYHPAAALHQPTLRPSLERDFAKLPEYILQADKAAPTAPVPAAAEPVSSTPVQVELPTAPPDEESPTQLTLF
ncbi:MAG TPA: uracil-DNA glycosylase [Longilinea sp.]|nr:uracil-DNA glycosylase [Longilinea sp.]